MAPGRHAAGRHRPQASAAPLPAQNSADAPAAAVATAVSPFVAAEPPVRAPDWHPAPPHIPAPLHTGVRRASDVPRGPAVPAEAVPAEAVPTEAVPAEAVPQDFHQAPPLAEALPPGFHQAPPLAEALPPGWQPPTPAPPTQQGQTSVRDLLATSAGTVPQHPEPTPPAFAGAPIAAPGPYLPPVDVPGISAKPTPRYGRVALVAALVLALAGAGIFGYHEWQSGQPSTATAQPVAHVATSPSAARATTDPTAGRHFVAPATFAGYRLAPASTVSQVTTQFRSALTAAGVPASSAQVALYVGSGSGGAQVIALAIPVATAPSLAANVRTLGPAIIASRMLDGESATIVAEHNVLGPVVSVNTGTKGGAMKCRLAREDAAELKHDKNALSRATGSVCVWVDSSFVTTTLVQVAQPRGIATLATDLRNAAER